MWKRKETKGKDKEEWKREKEEKKERTERLGSKVKGEEQGRTEYPEKLS